MRGSRLIPCPVGYEETRLYAAPQAPVEHVLSDEQILKIATEIGLPWSGLSGTSQIDLISFARAILATALKARNERNCLTYFKSLGNILPYLKQQGESK